MIDDGFREPILSGDEIRDLLRDDLRQEPRADSSPADELQSVLIVSRREDEVSLLRGRLELHGATVTVVRNPFAALDQMRTAHYQAIVTDLGLWASGGLLLFERWRPLESRPVLVFIADRGDASPETVVRRLRRSGAVDVLFRPIHARAVETAVLAILGGREEISGAHDASFEVPEASEDLLAEPAFEEAASAPGEGQAELAWLRLFFHASRMFRATVGIESRLRGLVTLFEEHLSPSLVAVSWSEGKRSFLIASTERAEDAESMLPSIRALGEASGEQAIVCSDPGPSGDMPFVSLVIAGLPDAHQFREDLRHLLAQVALDARDAGRDARESG